MHVFLCARTMTEKGIIAMIRNSSKLLTFHIHVNKITTPGGFITLINMKELLEKEFCKRKLFTYGNFAICDRILENLPFGHKLTFWENSNENFNNIF